MGITLINSDILDWLPTYTGNKFHAVFTDCPYEYGFMGKSWDASGVSFKSETWALIGSAMHDGAFGMTYAGARTWHRIAVAIEDAGMVIHPSIFAWVYASGLHKAARIDTQVDKAAGVYEEREVLEKSTATYGYQRSGERWAKDHFVTKPKTELALNWWHYRYGLQALRPAAEPVILFQKPYKGKPFENITGTGAGALWTEESKYGPKSKWPTNFFVAHHPLCTTSICHHDCNTLGVPREYYPSFGWEYDIAERVLVKHTAKAQAKEKTVGVDEYEKHPTIKPISANKWLASMLLPPPSYAPRNLLVPFSGIGSEVIGALVSGWDNITGVEITKDYYDVAQQRVSWWQDKVKTSGGDISKIVGSDDDEYIQTRMDMK